MAAVAGRVTQCLRRIRPPHTSLIQGTVGVWSAAHKLEGLHVSAVGEQLLGLGFGVRGVGLTGYRVDR